jgi:hypothetical protein
MNTGEDSRLSFPFRFSRHNLTWITQSPHVFYIPSVLSSSSPSHPRNNSAPWWQNTSIYASNTDEQLHHYERVKYSRSFK